MEEELEEQKKDIRIKHFSSIEITKNFNLSLMVFFQESIYQNNNGAYLINRNDKKSKATH